VVASGHYLVMKKNILEDNVDPGSVKPWLNNLAGVPYKNHVLICATIWLFNIAMGKSPFVIGKPSINGQFSMAMLNNQRVFHNLGYKIQYSI